MSRAVAIAALAALGAAGLLAWQAFAPERAPPLPGAAREASGARATPVVPTSPEAGSIDAALARPPFAPGRRPPAVARPAIAATEAPVPVAIAIAAERRIVLLRVPGIDRLVRAREGDRVGGWLVREVLADRITLVDPAGSVQRARLKPSPRSSPPSLPAPSVTPSAAEPPHTAAEPVRFAEEDFRVATNAP